MVQDKAFRFSNILLQEAADAIVEDIYTEKLDNKLLQGSP